MPEALAVVEEYRREMHRAERFHLDPYDDLAPWAPEAPLLPEALFALPCDVVEAILCRLPPIAMRLDHHFAPGIYARELTIPAGTLLTARRYRIPHLCICSAGEITVWEDGKAPVVYEAPHTYAGEAGARRIGYAHEETVWTTIMPCPEGMTDPEAVLDLWTEVPLLPERLIGKSLEELIEPGLLRAFFGGYLA